MDFKAIFENVATKVDGFARSAARKGEEVAETAKLNIALHSEQKKLEGMYTTLGKLFYEQSKGTDVRVQIKTQIMEIDEQKLTVEELKLSVAETKGKASCIHCGKDIAIDAVYCPACGNSQATGKTCTAEVTNSAADTETGAELFPEAEQLSIFETTDAE